MSKEDLVVSWNCSFDALAINLFIAFDVIIVMGMGQLAKIIAVIARINQIRSQQQIKRHIVQLDSQSVKADDLCFGIKNVFCILIAG